MCLPYDSTFPLLGIYTTNMKDIILQRHIHECSQQLYFKQPKLKTQTSSWINKLGYVLQMECYTAIKKNELFIHETIGINLKISMLSERCQTRKEYMLCEYICIKVCKMQNNLGSDGLGKRGQNKEEGGITKATRECDK